MLSYYDDVPLYNDANNKYFLYIKVFIVLAWV